MEKTVDAEKQKAEAMGKTPDDMKKQVKEEKQVVLGHIFDLKGERTRR